MNKWWGSVRVDGPWQIVDFQVAPVSLFLDGRRMKKTFKTLFIWLGSLIKAIKSDLKDYFELTFKLIFAISFFILSMLCLLLFLFFVVVLVTSLSRMTWN